MSPLPESQFPRTSILAWHSSLVFWECVITLLVQLLCLSLPCRTFYVATRGGAKGNTIEYLRVTALSLLGLMTSPPTWQDPSKSHGFWISTQGRFFTGKIWKCLFQRVINIISANQSVPYFARNICIFLHNRQCNMVHLFFEWHPKIPCK